jgi:hypothetical protein
VSRARAVVERGVANSKRTSKASPSKAGRRGMTTQDVVDAPERSTQKQAEFARKAQVCDSMRGFVRDCARAHSRGPSPRPRLLRRRLPA